jgi:hypothetical protein
MTIQTGDVKLVASQVMDDVENGGGAPSTTTIADGTSNAIYPDISELDRAGGRVNLRKVHVNIQTTNTDGYYGANFIVADPPNDPLVSVTAFSTGDVFDRRAAAASRIESYLVPSNEFGGYLFENHVQGQRVIQLFQRPGTPTPSIGQTLQLVANAGLNTEYSQYVRVTDVSTSTDTFTYSSSNGFVDYQAMVVSCEISDALRYDFAGSAAARTFLRESTKTVTRKTVVADAAVYYGASALDTAADTGDNTVQVESVFSQIVPSAQTEIPMVDKSAADSGTAVIACDNGSSMTFNFTGTLTIGATVSLGHAVQPGSISGNLGSTTLVDIGGNIAGVGTIDYASGLIYVNTAPIGTNHSVTFLPAAAPLQLADTFGIDVTLEGRGYNYIVTLPADAAPGSMSVSYRASGNWYTLTDNGAGVLKGSVSEYGTGTISYTTGTVSITLGALPDIGSKIVYSWARTPNYFNRADNAVAPVELAFTLANTDVIPGSLTITWTDGGTKTATDNGAGGFTSTACTGTIRYKTGEVTLKLNNLPSGIPNFSVAYNHGTPSQVTVTSPALSSGSMTINLDPDVKPGTVEVEWGRSLLSYPFQTDAPAGDWWRDPGFRAPFVRAVARDDGTGALKFNGLTVGSVNYTTGVVTLTPAYPQTASYPTYYKWAVFGDTPSWLQSSAWATGAAYWGLDTGQAVEARYLSVQAGNAATETKTPSGGFKIKLNPNYAETVVAGSVFFTLAGKTYFDRAGQLFTDLDLLTGAGTAAGSLNYSSGEGLVTLWAAGSNTVSLKSLLTRQEADVATSVTARIPVSPIRPGSVQIVATRAAGGQITGTSNNSGVISGTWMRGNVDYSTGTVFVEFGQMVTAAGNESKPWYDAANVVGSQVWKPEPVLAASVKYNAVAFSYLPLDADILGLDPVRLPQDGKVPIFRKGGFVVVGHTGTITATVSNSQTVNCARVRLSRVRVIGNDGVVINTGYTANLDAGTVTFNDVSGYSQPVTVEHRIEDMLQVSDVDISGLLSFTRQLTHDFPTGSYVSSALVAGDLRARVPVFFDQATWNGTTWQDSLSGSAATGTYNDALYPLEVTNKGATTERWAIQFTSSSAFNIIGEHVGVIGTGSINADCSPMNPATSTPYFTIRSAGWGLGWAAGNVLRFNTTGAIFPVWLIRTIQQGPETVTNDSFTVLVRGDIDTP